MNIDKVKTAIKIADIDQYWNILYNKEIDKNLLTDNTGRVYIITSNGEIKKIGGSVSKGGIKATLGFYKSAMKGNPSLRSYGVNILVIDEIKNGNKIEIYMILSDNVKASVKGLFDEEIRDISAFKEMENKCREDYKNVTGKYPDWNFQENGEKWPDYIRDSYEYISKIPT